MKTVIELASQGLDLIQRVEPGYRQHSDTYRQFRDYTMVWPRTYVGTLQLVETVAVKGAVVECGVWKGGMIAGIAKTLGQREYWLFDSFEGLPPPQPEDGVKAVEYQAATDSRYYYDNCTASEDDAAKAMWLAGVPEAHLVKGWFEDTLPGQMIPGGIAVLRMDADWYKSTHQILDVLFPQVNTGGLILIDDYRMWPGCRKAVHDYLDDNGRGESVQKFGAVHYIVKGQ